MSLAQPASGHPRRVLVTGINGFTGRYLEAALRQAGHDVYGTVSGNGPLADNHRAMDLTRAEQVRAVMADIQPEVVVHLAGIAFVAHGNPADFYQVNQLGTRNLLEALAGECPSCIGNVILASSANVYGAGQEGTLDEATPFSPANDYAVSKVAMEYVAGLWRSELPLRIVRPFNYTGVGQPARFLVPKIVDHFRQRADVIELGNLDVERDFSDVRAIVSAYVGLVDVPPTAQESAQAINLCAGVSHSLRDVIALCTELTGHDLRVTVNPDFVRRGEVRVLRGDPSKLQALLPGWAPTPFRKTLQWMLDVPAAG